MIYPIIYTYICLRTENRSRKTRVFEYRDCGLGWGGVGWGGMLTFLLLRTWYIAMLLRSLGSFTTWHVATLLRSLVWVGVGWGGVGGHVNVPCTSYMIYCHAAKISGIVYDVTCCYAAKISGIADYVTCCYACVAAMTLKSQKTRPKFFQDFQSSNQHGTVVKSHFFFKKTCVLWERFPVRRVIYP